MNTDTTAIRRTIDGVPTIAAKLAFDNALVTPSQSVWLPSQPVVPGVCSIIQIKQCFVIT